MSDKLKGKGPLSVKPRKRSNTNDTYFDEIHKYISKNTPLYQSKETHLLILTLTT